MKGSTRITKESLKKIVMDYEYVELIKNWDLQNRDSDELASYFCTIGMQDTDIIHTIMAVKEMIACEYVIDAEIDNSQILTGERHPSLP